MSEHFTVTGDVDFYHWPYDEDYGMAYCSRCKKVKNKLSVEFNQGWLSRWIRVICPTCKKTMYVSKLTSEEDEGTNGWQQRIVDNKKCSVCKKPTNKYDSYSEGTLYFYGKKKIDYILCSKKCNSKWKKIEQEYFEKQLMKNKTNTKGKQKNGINRKTKTSL